MAGKSPPGGSLAGQSGLVFHVGARAFATAAQQGGSSGKLGQVANINTTTPNKPVPPSVINLVSPDLVPPSPPSGAQANPIDAETDQVSEGKHRRRAIFLD